MTRRAGGTIRSGSRPVGVTLRNEHTRMADGEDVDFSIYGFINDAIRPAECLAKPVKVLGNRLEAFRRDG